MKNLDKFMNDQLSRWPLACENFRSLRNVETRRMTVGGLEVVLQHNPARIISSAAKLDKATLSTRKCFLCRDHRPEEQISQKFEGRKGKKYDILVNPYPIFANHLVIAMEKHCDQSIWRRYVDMLDLARAFQKFTVFYNGPKCGASAPDHHHFQAASKGQMPLEKDIDRLFEKIHAGQEAPEMEYVSEVQDAQLYHYRKYIPGVFAIKARTSKSAAKMFYRLLDCAPVKEGESEPMFNAFCWYRNGEFRTIVVFRAVHRTHHYFSDGPDHLTMSPGCADMAGCLVVPVKEEFEKIDEPLLTSLVTEAALAAEQEELILRRLTRTQPEVSVGIMSAREIEFEVLSDGAGARKAVYREGKIEYDGSLYDELFFEAKTLSTMFAEPTFVLYGVTIGVGFHWERKEDQKFAGALHIIVEKDHLTAVNVIGVEDYLVSVISSEMKATAAPEFLKAHAVISRSWLMSQIRRRGTAAPQVPEGISNVPALMSFLDALKNSPESVQTPQGQEYVKWYDKDDHKNFDVCADDHCQRYQGLTRAVGNAAKIAVDATWGKVLSYDGEICDARFSKCCGGVMERFSSCWEDKDYPYLQGIPDTGNPDRTLPMDASDEESVRKWIRDGQDDAFCGNAKDEVLSQVLNSYDMETRDFFRWKTEYGREELSALFNSRTGLGIGEIQALVPVQRGTSGRLVRLKVIGSEKTVVIGKELEIRRALSESHLKSSAFVADYYDAEGRLLDHEAVENSANCGKPLDFCKIVLSGAGWGHGVGLCQIGAAVMASEGHDYQDILQHYYPGTGLEDISR